jgi:hypothetical protein
MIVRLWKGRAPVDAAGAYERHAVSTVFPKLQQFNGFVRGRILRRERDRDVEFLVMTEWESPDAISDFAGDSLDLAVVAPEARAVLSDFDAHVEHFQVVREVSRIR